MDRRLSPLIALSALALPVILVTGAEVTPVAAASPVTAVVSFTGALPAVDGVTVTTVLPAVRAAVVSATPADLAVLAGSPGVRSVVPDRAMHVTAGSGSSASPVWASSRLGGGAGRVGAGAGVRVAVVDTGVSDTPALDRASGRLVDAVDTSSGKGPDRGSGDLVDGFGHGTFMATIVAGGPVPGSNGRAVGVAPSATVLVVRVAEPDGTTSLSRVLRGLDWVASHADEVDVVNLSLGAERPGDRYQRDPLTDAVQAVQDAGVTAVVAAGNVRGTVSDPGFLPTTITVGSASVRTGSVAADSGSDVVARVRKPDVVASGVSVLGVLPEDSVIAGSNPGARVGEGLWRGSGTSQAAAVASGVSAVLLARYPDATPSDVKASLQAAATDLESHRDGSGLIRVPSGLTDVTSAPAEDGPDSTGPSGDPSFESSTWDSSSWDSSTWDSSTWDSSTWDSSTWDSSTWDSSTWDSSTWDSSTWDSSTWDSSTRDGRTRFPSTRDSSTWDARPADAGGTP